MIVYSATKAQFNSDVNTNIIADKILKRFEDKFGHSTSKAEISSWKNSMMYMNNILMDNAIPGNAGVSIEYRIPLTSNRIDFILTGKNQDRSDTAIIIELKQWSDVKRTSKDAIVETFIGRSERETSHPSYQAWSYSALLRDFNETVRDENILLNPCAYLHNCDANDVINHSFYFPHTSKAPAFLKNDTRRLQEFIKKHVKYGDTSNIMYRIDHGKIKPSKNLADTLVSLLQGNKEFVMIDDQKLVYETVLSLAKQSTTENKHVLIVEGGPGTGKSVIAVNLLVELTRQEMLVQYVTKNAAPRQVYAAKLKGTFTKNHIDNLFKGSGSYCNCKPNSLDVLVVDEAHRLNAKSGMYQNHGENQIKEIINTAKHSVFFIDEDQRVTWKDIGEKQEIRRWANQLNAKVHELELASQFRCNGSDGYLAWVDNILGIKKTVNESLEGIDFDFRVFNSPKDLRDFIFKKNRINNKARMVAGYCWDWVSAKHPESDDIVIDEFKFSIKWNLKTDGSLWIMKRDTVNEIGCIHTCQGLEVDYIGVIIGPDLIIRDGEIITDAAQRSKMDSSIRGYKKLLKEKPIIARKRADLIIKNTYRTLMTRGHKGCYIYSTDPETNIYFAKMAKGVRLDDEQALRAEGIQVDSVEKLSEQYPGLTLRLLKPEEVNPFVNSVPIYDIKIAAGQFSEEQQVENYDWVELPDSFRPKVGQFVTRIVGESMNKRIPNGAWCLFKKNPSGSRNGKVVLAQHREIYDSETGGHFTVKIYHSEKEYSPDGSWFHSRIKLCPDSNLPGFEPIIISLDQGNNLKIIAELVAVLV